MDRRLVARIALICVLVDSGAGACLGACCESAETARHQRGYAVAKRHEVDAFEPVEGRTLESAYEQAPFAGGEYRFLVRVDAHRAHGAGALHRDPETRDGGGRTFGRDGPRS